MPGLAYTPENVAKFDAFIDSLGLKHFKPYEIRIHCEHPLNGLPPEKLWPNIVPTIRLLDEFRGIIGGVIMLNSTWRSQEYNKKIGGASASNHKSFAAIDWHLRAPMDATVRNKFDAFVKKLLKEGKIKRAGRGYYRLSFIHIDTNHDNGARPLGKLTTWTG